MSKHTDSSLLIVSSVPALYQRLLSGAASYEELGNRVLRQIKAAHAFRRVEQVRELAGLLVKFPIREFHLIGQYYLVWCKCREAKYEDDVLERIAEQTKTYKFKALSSRGTFELYRGNSENALFFYTEASRAAPTISEYIDLSKSIAALKSQEGFHEAAVRDIERLIPLLRYAEPLTYYDVINSYAVELGTVGRLTEACNAIKVVGASPFTPFYPEWQETLLDLRQKHKTRSRVAISRQTEQGSQSVVSENALDRARVNAVIDFMKANLHRRILLPELAAVVNLSPSYVSYLFNAEVGVSPGEYLIRLKMEEAGRLLRTTFLSIKQIMAEVGYNKSNFGRSFKLRFHVSPSLYRQQALASKPIKDE